MATFKHIFSIAAGAAATMLAGCSASQMSPQIPTQAAVRSAVRSPLTAPTVKNHCPAHGGVRATPCSVDLNASSPGPDTIVVRVPRTKKGTLVESDDCGYPSYGIATVAQGSGNTWTVTAGALTGSCTAEFDYLNYKHGKKIGWAQLSITNEI